MSLTFSITPPASGHRPMTLAHALALGPDGLRPYGIADDDLDTALAYGLDRGIFHVGIDPYSSRGSELNVEDGAYLVRVFTPATSNDWRIALDLLAALSRELGAPIHAEDGTRHTAESIRRFPFPDDIRAGLRAFSAQLERSPSVLVHGVHRSVDIDRGMLDHILSASDPVATFDAIMQSIQHTDAHVASQMAAIGPDGDVVGMYALTEGVDTVLPHSPRLPEDVRARAADASVSWRLTLVAVDGDPDDPESYDAVDEVDLLAALPRLPRHKVSPFDATHLLVRGLTREELLALR